MKLELFCDLIVALIGRAIFERLLLFRAIHDDARKTKERLENNIIQ